MPCPGSRQLGDNIAETFRAGCDSVILENHGVVVGGESLSHAFQRFEAFEFAAKTVIKGRHLGDVRYLTEAPAPAGPRPQRRVGVVSSRPRPRPRSRNCGDSCTCLSAAAAGSGC